MMTLLIYRTTLILGSVLLLFYTALIPYLLIFYISANYMKLGEPQADHLVKRAESPQKARGPPKTKGKSLNLRRLKNSDYGIFWEKMAEMFYKYCTCVKQKCKTCKTLV